MQFAFGSKPKAPLSAFVELVKLGERLGFATAWVPDQTFFPDPFVSIAACATATKTIELMVGVVNPYTRNPVQVARAVGTLDDLAPGRIALGYGAGNRKELILPLGGEQDRPVARCREAVTVIRQLFCGEMVQYQSDTLIVDGIELEFPAHPNIPIYIAGRGPLMLQVAGELADVAVIGGLVSPEGLEFAIEHVRKGSKRAGRNFDDLDIMSWITCYITNDKARWIDQYRPSAAHILAGAPKGVFEAMKLDTGFMNELKEIYREGGSEAAARIVPDEVVANLSAIGTADEVVEKLQLAADLGVSQVGILVNPTNIDESRAFLERFADDVMPAFV